MAKTMTLCLEKDAYDELQAARRRPLATFIATAALAQIREAQLVDDEETADILGNEALLRRLRAGSQQAHQRRGDFVALAPDSAAAFICTASFVARRLG